MTALLENPLPIWVAGAVATTFAGIVFLSRRSLGSLIAVAAVVLATLALVAVERMVVTPREQIETAVHGVLDAIEANVLQRVLTFVDPGATIIVADAKAAMAEVDVQRANIEGTLTIDVQEAGQPQRGTAKFRGILIGNARRGGVTVGFRDQVEIDWVRRGESWLIDAYRVFENGQPIDVRGRARR